MVLSKIDGSISYTELKKMHPDDMKMEADLYEIEVHGVDIVIAVGNAKKNFEEKGILYYPIYLVKTNKTVTQIGVYEIVASDLIKYLDEDGNLDVEKLDDPLIYKFVSKRMLEDARLIPETKKPEKREKKEEDDEESEDEEDEDEDEEKEEKKKEKEGVSPSEVPDHRKDIFILTKGITIPPLLREETKEQAKDIREKYKSDKTHNWLQQFMKNKYYGITDNEGGGDCLFATIRDAFSQIGQQTSVAKLRKKLSGEATQEIFANYKQQYDMYKSAIAKDTNDIKELEKHYVDIKAKFSQVLDHNEQKQLVESAKKVKAQHDRLIQEKHVSAQIMKEEFSFMSGLDTLEKFKQKICTCEFWGETWALSTLERILNIKFILLSREAYKSKDFDNVLQCGQLNDSILENKGEFKPDFYIIVDFLGWHYMLISYRKKQIFTFAELPYDIKKLITDKCMERNAGPFALIPEFQKFKLDTTLPAEPNFEELNEAKLLNMYDDNIIFNFYEKSAGKPLPGKGSGEKIPKEDMKRFTELAIIPDWRKKLSNFWMQPFTLDNHQWASVEHYYQGAKFKKNNPEFYLSFSLDSGTDLSKDPEMAKNTGGKTGKYKGVLIRPKEVKIDEEFYGPRAEKEMNQAQMAKFSQNPDLKQLLLATQNAKLAHHLRGKAPELFEGLMMIREKFRKE